MAIRRQRHWTGTLTLTGNAQQVLAGLFTEHTNLRDISLQQDPANVGPLYIGHNNGLTSANYGTRIPAPVSSEPSPPWMREGFADGTITLEQFWVKGTLGDVVHIDVLLFDDIAVTE